MSRSEMERALKRPLNYSELSSYGQWCVDDSLDILDWSPDKEESDEYVRRRAEMGDKSCQRYLEKRTVDNA